MKLSLKTITTLGAGLLLAGTATAMADQKSRTYELNDGTVHENPGEMFQQLRDREIEDFRAGNPKEIVEAYPEEFENVGDLIRQKRVDE